MMFTDDSQYHLLPLSKRSFIYRISTFVFLSSPVIPTVVFAANRLFFRFSQLLDLFRGLSMLSTFGLSRIIRLIAIRELSKSQQRRRRLSYYLQIRNKNYTCNALINMKFRRTYSKWKERWALIFFCIIFYFLITFKSMISQTIIYLFIYILI